jgi:hypothetical protein
MTMQDEIEKYAEMIVDGALKENICGKDVSNIIMDFEAVCPEIILSNPGKNIRYCHLKDIMTFYNVHSFDN